MDLHLTGHGMAGFCSHCCPSPHGRVTPCSLTLPLNSVRWSHPQMWESWSRWQGLRRAASTCLLRGMVPVAQTNLLQLPLRHRSWAFGWASLTSTQSLTCWSMMGLVLLNNRCRISITQENHKISERRFLRSSYDGVPEAFNQKK